MTGLMKYRNVRWPQTYRKYAVIAVIENKTVRELEKKINTSSFKYSLFLKCFISSLQTVVKPIWKLQFYNIEQEFLHSDFFFLNLNSISQHIVPH